MVTHNNLKLFGCGVFQLLSFWPLMSSIVTCTSTILTNFRELSEGCLYGVVLSYSWLNEALQAYKDLWAILGFKKFTVYVFIRLFAASSLRLVC